MPVVVEEGLFTAVPARGITRISPRSGVMR